MDVGTNDERECQEFLVWSDACVDPPAYNLSYPFDLKCALELCVTSLQETDLHVVRVTFSTWAFLLPISCQLNCSIHTELWEPGKWQKRKEYSLPDFFHIPSCFGLYHVLRRLYRDTVDSVDCWRMLFADQAIFCHEWLDDLTKFSLKTTGKDHLLSWIFCQLSNRWALLHCMPNYIATFYGIAIVRTLVWLSQYYDRHKNSTWVYTCFVGACAQW